ncbi:MAG: RICIN domain-containing protein [Chloroflexi bacterium]|nr:RICIN domain-containing protein [Chloroflexota bacterium]
MTTMRRNSAIFAGVLLLAAAACGTSGPAPTPETAPTRVVEATATPIAVPPTPTTAVPTPTTPAPTPAGPSASGIDVDPAKAEATLVQLVDALDEPEYYCVDVPGFGRSLNLEAALMAHTCKPGADDEMFAINRPGPGNLYMPAYGLCMEADRAGSPVHLYLRECTGSTLQQFELDPGGRLVLVGTGLCMAVSPEDGEPTGGPSHLRRDLVMLDCNEAERGLMQWAFPGSSPE